jgi:hypothetical protein
MRALRPFLLFARRNSPSCGTQPLPVCSGENRCNNNKKKRCVATQLLSGHKYRFIFIRHVCVFQIKYLARRSVGAIGGNSNWSHAPATHTARSDRESYVPFYLFAWGPANKSDVAFSARGHYYLSFVFFRSCKMSRLGSGGATAVSAARDKKRDALPSLRDHIWQGRATHPIFGTRNCATQTTHARLANFLPQQFACRLASPVGRKGSLRCGSRNKRRVRRKLNFCNLVKHIIARLI